MRLVNTGILFQIGKTDVHCLVKIEFNQKCLIVILPYLYSVAFCSTN